MTAAISFIGGGLIVENVYYIAQSKNRVKYLKLLI